MGQVSDRYTSTKSSVYGTHIHVKQFDIPFCCCVVSCFVFNSTKDIQQKADVIGTQVPRYVAVV